MIKTFMTVVLCVLALSGIAQAAIINGGFEAGNLVGPPTGWTDTDTTYGYNRCSLADCGGVGVPHTGTYYIWFGGATAAQTAKLEQTGVVIPAGSTSLDFWFVITHYEAPATLTLSIDGLQQWSATEKDWSTYQTYTPVSIALGGFADGLSHTLTFNYSDSGATNFMLDDVSLAGVSEVPEPATVALLGAGLAALALLRRKG